MSKEGYFYLIRWMGLGRTHDSWETHQDIETYYPDLLKKFQKEKDVDEESYLVKEEGRKKKKSSK